MRLNLPPLWLVHAVTAALLLPNPAWSNSTCPAGGETASVVQVLDHHSLALADGRIAQIAGIESFAILGIDPTAAEQAIQAQLRELSAVGELLLHPIAEKPDRYGRVPALAFSGSELLQVELALRGMAIAFSTARSLPCFDAILAAEDDARRSGRGFWKGVALPKAQPQALQPFSGRFAIFEGDVLSVGNRPSRTYLNFGTWWAEDVSVEIAATDRARFGGEAQLAELSGKRVRVRGYVEDRAGPAMTINSPLQLEVLQFAAEGARKEP